MSRHPDRFTGATVEAARRALTSRFRAGSIESAELDARTLVGAVLGLDLTGLIAAAGRPLAPEEASRIEEFAQRRCGGEPVARIVGGREFWGLPFQLSAATLVPRPDTEAVVELALEMLRGIAPAQQSRIADLGTGSGAILLALLSELPDCYGVGTDISAAALRVARTNAVNLGLAGRAGFVACCYATALSGRFDLIVSNPPYIRSADIAELATEVREHDPVDALDGGADGLDGYRTLIPQATALLADRGALVVEVGYAQSRDVQQLMSAAGLAADRPAKSDLAGVERAVAGRKLPP